MKKVILFIAFLGFNIILLAQVELKGIKLGSIYPGEIHSYSQGSESIKTTVGGLKSILYIRLLADNRVYRIMFTPQVDYSLDPDPTLHISINEVNNLVKGLDNKYKLEFIKQLENKDNWKFHSGEYEFFDFKDGVKYSIRIINHNIEKAYPISFFLTMTNQRLEKLHDEQKQKKNNSDF